MYGSEDFHRGWTDYVAGFGNLKREYWLGLGHINCLTSSAPRTELRVELADFFGNYKYAHYGFFNVNDASTNYTLDIADYKTTSTVRDRLSSHNGMQFTTKDRGNDQSASGNYASIPSGAWWFEGCYYSNLNGLYRFRTSWGNIHWYPLADGAEHAMKFTQMKMRFRD